jgi:hypothetical protein
MPQHDYVLDDANGAAFLADNNAVIQAIVQNNSGATEPATKFPNMWWYDTSTSLLKRRNNANDAWIVMGLEAADTDGTLAANSDSKVPTQKATKTYVDNKTIVEAKLSLSDNTTANATTSNHGFLKKLSNVATEFMNGVGNWVAVTIDALLPSQTGHNGKYLTTNGSASSWGAIVTVTPYSAGTVIDASAPTDRTTSSTSYAKVKEFSPLIRSGTITVSFTLSSAGNAAAKVYINNSAAGTERTTNGTHTQDFTVAVGDVVQLYAKKVDADPTISDFQILVSNPTVPTELASY